VEKLSPDRGFFKDTFELTPEKSPFPVSIAIELSLTAQTFELISKLIPK
jgi:hypothetical protein